MLPFKTLLRIDKASRVPKYVQLSNQLIQNISSGIIPTGIKLPGSRQLSLILGINRRTVISAYEELLTQGWIHVHPNKGCFVNDEIPDIKPKAFHNKLPVREKIQTSFKSIVETGLVNEMGSFAQASKYELRINDGHPDVRLAPLKQLAKNFSYIMTSPMATSLMNYRQAYYGDVQLREQLVKYLKETRSINVSINNILITRGSLMACYLLFQTLLKKGDNVAVGFPGFNEGYNSIRLAKGNLCNVPVDENGMDIDYFEALCKKKKIRAIFIIPHHHYPTTVSLSASRRVRLLQLAEKYGFAIVEDDYDYDYHYASSPILPIASTDYLGSVAYVGSFSKTIAPSLRIGFIVAPENLIHEISLLSRFVDSHGNIALERAVALLFKEGLIRRHLRKALTTYRERRNTFCELLKDELHGYLSFDKPEGGLAVWVKLSPDISLRKLIDSCSKLGLYVPNELGFGKNDFDFNAIRMGFASMTSDESKRLISRLRLGFKNCK